MWNLFGENSAYRLSFPGGSDAKESTCQCRRWEFDPWVGKILWRREWVPTPVFLPEESHRQKSLVGYRPWGRKEYIKDLFSCDMQTLHCSVWDLPPWSGSESRPSALGIWSLSHQGSPRVSFWCLLLMCANESLSQYVTVFYGIMIKSHIFGFTGYSSKNTPLQF